MLLTYLASGLAWLTLLAPGAARPGVDFTEDSLEIVKKNVASKKAVLVDVRSREEWNRGHIDGSVFVPVTSLRKHSLDPKKLAKAVPKKKIVYTFCVVGMRAKAAATILEQHGYKVRALKPGYEQLLKAGFKKGRQKKAQDNREPLNPAPKHDDSR